jgi:hypothetical protein
MLKIPYEYGKLNFIIDCRHSFGESLSGGIVVLQKLALDLIELGHNVYIPTLPMYSDKIIEIPTYGRTNNNYVNSSFGYDVFEYPIDNTIAIYPEITCGNPYNTKYVVRWLLYDTKENVENTWSNTDFIYNFANFKTFEKSSKKELTTFDLKIDEMINKNYENRKGFCFLNHKNTPENYLDIIKQFTPTELNGWETKGAWSFLSEEFNKHEYFITFDRRTTFCVLAAMCGCKSIILNEDPSILPIEFRKQTPAFQYGVSYGLKDISWANNTVHLTREYILQLNKYNKKTVVNFVNDLKNIIYEK